MNCGVHSPLETFSSSQNRPGFFSLFLLLQLAFMQFDSTFFDIGIRVIQ